MSFHLYFCRESSFQLDFGDVVKWAKQIPHFSRTAEGQLWYENKDTGVYFSLDFSPEDVAGVQGEAPLPPGWSYTGLFFLLNLNRPSFFAYEAMPILVELCKTFAFLVVDPQGDDLSPWARSSQALIASWCENNREAVAALQADPEFKDSLLYMPEQVARESWGYMHQVGELGSWLAKDDVFVPRLFLVRRKESRRVCTAIAWLAGVHMTVPPSDWVIVGREKRGSGEKDVGYVASRVVLERVGHYLDVFDPDRNLKILRPEKVAAVERELGSLEFNLRTSDFDSVPADGFQDVLPDEPEAIH